MESRENTFPGQEKNMNSVNAPSYRLIRTPADLEHFAGRISQEKILAVDLEADSMFHYQEKVCLLQMAGNGENVVIDPLVVNDLSPLVPLFSDKDICKVFHGSDYDVRSLYRDFSIEINNLRGGSWRNFCSEAERIGLLERRPGARVARAHRARAFRQSSVPCQRRGTRRTDTSSAGAMRRTILLCRSKSTPPTAACLP